MAFDDQPFQEEGEAGAPRPGYAQLLGALAGVDLADLRGRVNRHLAEREVTFGTRPFVVDPIPRLITPGEWEELAAGLAQRADALNAVTRATHRRGARLRITSVEARTALARSSTPGRGSPSS